jgi:hypothetical protein
VATDHDTSTDPTGDPQGTGASTTETPETGQQGDPAATGQEIRNPAAVLSALHAERTRARDLERQLAAFQAERQEQTATLEQRLAALETERAEAQRAALVTGVWAEASSRGASNRRLIERLVENDATDAAAEVERIATEYPELFQTGSGTPKPDTAGRGRGTTAPDPKPFNPLAALSRRTP